MNEELQLALKKMNEAWEHLNNFISDSYYDEELDFDAYDVQTDLEEAIEPLSDLYQKYF